MSDETTPGSGSPAACGFALVFVLLLTLAAAVIVSARYASDRVEVRTLRRVERERLVSEALAFGLALIETRLRARFASADAIPFGEIIAPDEDGGLSARVNYEAPGAAALAKDASISVDARVLPLAEPTWSDVVVRDPVSGESVRALRRSAFLPEASRAELRVVLAPHFSGPAAPAPEDPNSVDLLVALVAAVREGVYFPADPDEFSAQLGASIDAAAAALLPGSESLLAMRDDLLLALDPRPRLRRTNSHAARAGGRDRGRIETEGGVLAPDFSGRFLLEARVIDGPDLTPAPLRIARRRIDLIGRATLRYQEDWLLPGIDQPGGVSMHGASQSGGVALGPEVAGDAEWILGAAHFVAAPPDTTVLGRMWHPLPQGAIGTAQRSTLFLWRTGEDTWQAREYPTSEPYAAVHLIASRRAPRSWYMLGAEAVFRAGDPADPPSKFLRTPLPAVQALYALGEMVLAVATDGSLFSIRDDLRATLVVEPAGSLASIDAESRARGVALPHLDALLFPPNEGTSAWHALDRSLALSALQCTESPPSSLAPAGDGGAGLWWITESDSGPRLIHAEAEGMALLAHASEALEFEPQRIATDVGGDRVLLFGVGSAGTPHASIWRRAETGIVPAGGGELPALFGEGFLDARGTVLHLPTPEGLWCIPMESLREKRQDLGCELVLIPDEDSRSIFLRAPLIGDLAAILLSGQRIAASGTVNHGGSVLVAGDLSDLVGDGLYLSPLRNETLRYDGIESELTGAYGAWNLSTGGAALLVKPERAAADAADPENERVVARTTQEFEVRFQPSAAWIARCHPAALEVGEIHSFSVAGNLSRSGEVVSTLRRLPASATWTHRREIRIDGAPWVVSVTAGDPPIEFSPWTIDQALPGHVLASSALVADTGAGGVWQSIAWGWRSGGAAYLRVGTNDAWDASLTPESLPRTEFDDAVWLITPGDWSVEMGGEIGGKAFRGTVAQLRLFDDAAAAAATPSRIFSPRDASVPDVRWLVAHTLTAGSRLRSAAAEAVLPSGTELEWRVRCLMAGSAPQTAPPQYSAVGTRILFPPEIAAIRSDTRIEVALWLHPDAHGMNTPLIEGLELEWINAPLEPASD